MIRFRNPGTDYSTQIQVLKLFDVSFEEFIASSLFDRNTLHD